MKNKIKVVAIIFVTCMITFGLAAIASTIATTNMSGSFSGWNANEIATVSQIFLIGGFISLIALIVMTFFLKDKE